METSKRRPRIEVIGRQHAAILAAKTPAERISMVFAAQQSGAKSLTVADVAAMASGGVSNEIILNQISTTKTRFVLSADNFVFQLSN